MQFLQGEPMTAVVAVLLWCCGLVQTAPLAAPQSPAAGAQAAAGPSPSAFLAPAFTPEVAAAMQAFLQEFQAQAAIAAQFPDDPVDGQPVAAPAAFAPAQGRAATFPVVTSSVTSSAPAAAPPPPNALQARSGPAGVDAVPPVPAYTIPEAYAHYHTLLAPPPAHTLG